MNWLLSKSLPTSKFCESLSSIPHSRLLLFSEPWEADLSGAHQWTSSPLVSSWVGLIKSTEAAQRRTRRLRLGTSALPPCGFTLRWMYHLTNAHSFHETSLSTYLSPHSTPYTFQNFLPLSSFVTTGGGGSTKLLLALGRCASSSCGSCALPTIR